MKVYISGKITGLDFKEAFNNFEIAEKQLIKEHFEVVNPTNIKIITGLNAPDPTWEDFMRIDITELMKCDAIYMLKDWKDSKGAIIEHNLAKELNFIVIYENE